MTPLLLTLLALALLGVYAFAIEPRRVELTQREFALERLPSAFDGFRFWHVADIHAGKIGARERNLLQLLREHGNPQSSILNPQCSRPIFFTGDMPFRNLQRREPFDLLQELLTLGEVWLVVGNHDKPRPGRGDFAPIAQALEATPAHLLFNRSEPIVRDGGRLWIAGVDDPDDGAPDLDRALEGVPADACVVLLAHSPDIYIAANGRVDLILSGHTHGGQVRLPFIGALVTRTNKTPRRLCMGAHKLGSRTHLFVSRGVGLSRLLPARFLCRPEVTLVTLRRATS